ncbi:2-methylisocitrate lyase [Spirochaetota bacterium]|nr:2-methylisocitrate lyase [Spirochaetota bacterium]
MLFNRKEPRAIRADFRAALKTDALLRLPGAYAPLIAMAIERIGFEGVYVSGAVMANDLGYPDIGLVGLEQIAARSHQIVRVTKLPVLADVDTGFGESMNFARTVQLMEEAGLTGIHLEDQTNPKRCGHLDNKELVPIETMVRKIEAGLRSKRDDNFLIMVRSDARGVEGMEHMLRRIKAYEAAGAEAIFPEALQSEKEFATVRDNINVPLLANMTEFGKTKLLDAQTLHRLGYNMVIYPVTTQRLALKNVITGLETIDKTGSQNSILTTMQTRKELYDLVRYQDYEVFDKDVYNIGVDQLTTADEKKE